MLDEGSMWSYTWINLDKDAEWTVKEISKLPSGYLSPVYTGQGGNKVVITNTYLASASSDYDGHIGGISSVSVVKHWGGDVNENQPTQVKVQLYKNNEPYGKPVILNAQNNWSYRWQLLSNRFTWTVDEVDVPEGYTKIINQVGDATIITNIYDPEIEPLNPEQPQAPEESEGIEGSKDSENTEDTENPNTASIGQSINFYLLLCCLSGVLLVICDLKRNFK